MNDDRLRDAFHELRRSEANLAPRFDRIWRSTAPHILAPRFAFAAVFLIVIALSLFPLVRRTERMQPSITAWKAPTDFLLATPGRELLQSTPELRGSQP